MGITADIHRLESGLEELTLVDAHWVTGQLRRARSRQRQGKPVDQLLEKVVQRVQASHQRLQQRQDKVPQPDYDPELPITAHREDIIEAIREHPVLIVAGETGSGKTTQLPKFCLEAGRGMRGLIGCTQPRRIAARAMASRVSEELGTEPGQAVGYQVRFRENTSPDSYIKFMTDGILLAEAIGDRRLQQYDTIIIDEAHERSLNIDFLLGYLKQLSGQRPELRIIITSATIDTEKFARHFDNAPVIEVSGRGYPVEVRYRELEGDGGDNRDLYRGIVDAVHELERIDRRGDILVFLSGEREIHEARDQLERANLRSTEVLPLYARLSGAEQQRVFHPGAARRIILSTNVAETSLTVPRIQFVIDTGLARISRYAHRSRIQRLPIEPVSQASANQRMGRCGRLGPGTCIRLYSEEDFLSRPEFTDPEILRTSLASVILRLKTMGLGAVEEFPFIDPPAPRMINDAYQLLFELGALDGERDVTPAGRQLSRWPVDVRLGRMILEGEKQGCLEDTLVLAAAQSIQDPRERPLEAQQAADEAHGRFKDELSDFASLLSLWKYLRKERQARNGNQFRKLCKREFLAWQRVLEWFDLYQQLRDLARENRMPLTGQHGDYDALHKALLSGLLSQVGQKHPEDRSYQGARQRTFHIFPGSGLFGKTPKWIMSAEIVETSKPYARTNARIDPAWLETQGAHLLKHTYMDPHWSRRRGKVLAWEQVSLFGLIIVEKRRVDYTSIDPGEARRLFILEALVRGELDTRAPFLEANRQAREELERLEHKRRQRDVLVDEAALAEFFDARIPPEVATAKSLTRWLATLDQPGLQQLHLGESVLLREDAGDAPAEQFPDDWFAAGKRFSLAYRFDPGHPADGVSLVVPLELLNTLNSARLSWQVPGLRRDLVVELMRTLPKPMRRALTPLPQFADAAVDALGEPDERSLSQALVDTLQELAGVELDETDFSPSLVPDHLRVRIVVQDEAGDTLEESRDFEGLQDRLGQQAQREFMDRQGSDWNRDGIIAWLPGDLPEQVTTPEGTLAYPALVDQEDSVGLRLFESWEEAAINHDAGILRLISLTLPDKMRWMYRQHGLSKKALLSWAPVGASEALIEALAWRALVDTVGLEGQAVRLEPDWDALLEDTRRRIGGVFQDLSRQLDSVLLISGRIRQGLAAAGELPQTILEDLQAQMDDMLYPDFLAELESGRLAHYPRYLQALEERLERAQLDPGKDQRLMAQLEPFWTRYQQYLESGADYTEQLDQYRWLVAEFRVSIFAQRLGTAEKVSAKRLEEVWQAVLEA